MRSLESGDHYIDVELKKLAGRLEQLAEQVDAGTPAKAA